MPNRLPSNASAQCAGLRGAPLAQHGTAIVADVMRHRSGPHGSMIQSVLLDRGADPNRTERTKSAARDDPHHGLPMNINVAEVATLSRQCWLFAIGSSLFAIATAPGFSALGGAGAANALCFVGSWFFTSAALIQLLLSRPLMQTQWLSAATQFVGTLLFNISTGAALWAHAIPEKRHLVWTPDAGGSIGFLISGALGIVAVTIAVGFFARTSRDWQAEWINMIGSIAFGVSAIGAFVRRTGVTEDALLANVGTFVGALCFLVAALLVLPRFRDRPPTPPEPAA